MTCVSLWRNLLFEDVAEVFCMMKLLPPEYCQDVTFCGLFISHLWLFQNESLSQTPHSVFYKCLFFKLHGNVVMVWNSAEVACLLFETSNHLAYLCKVETLTQKAVHAYESGKINTRWRHRVMLRWSENKEWLPAILFIFSYLLIFFFPCLSFHVFSWIAVLWSSDFLFKFLVIGSAGTGKSCLLHQFIENKCKCLIVLSDIHILTLACLNFMMTFRRGKCSV